MKKWFIAVSVLLILGPLAEHSLAGSETREAMRQKLTFAQGVLEGLTLEKFDLVITNAARLRELGQTNAFTLLGNPSYRQRSTNFFQSVDGLTQAARKQDLRSATEAFTRVTQNCVDCHKLFRREQSLKSQQEASKP